MRINDDLRAKGEHMNDMRLRRDQLDARKMKRKGLAELRTGLQNACGEYDKMADDLEQQVDGIYDITQRVNQAIEDRGDALNEQIGKNGELS